MNIFALHGFLGTGDDWLPIKKTLSERELWTSAEWCTPDLFSAECPYDVASFPGWVRSVWKDVASAEVLIGYSLGGRLILELLKFGLATKIPPTWKEVVLLSAHPGMYDGEMRMQRLQQDSLWAARFLEYPLEEVLPQWDGQDVFKNSKAPDRSKILSKLHPKRLAMALEGLSLAHQNFEAAAFQVPMARLRVFLGANDSKFRSIYKGLQLGCESQVIPASGHRLLLDNPEAMALALAAQA